MIEDTLKNLDSRGCSCHPVVATEPNSHALSYFVLCSGFALLVAFAWSEYYVFISMKKNLKVNEIDGKYHRSVSVREFIKYRLEGDADTTSERKQD